jgi:hypothetical protein
MDIKLALERVGHWKLAHSLTLPIHSLLLYSQMYVDDESFIDMATSISGSGPAYIFMLMESMIDAGVHMVRTITCAGWALFLCE